MGTQDAYDTTALLFEYLKPFGVQNTSLGTYAFKRSNFSGHLGFLQHAEDVVFLFQGKSSHDNSRMVFPGFPYHQHFNSKLADNRQVYLVSLQLATCP
jgi:hypothetical protein